MRTQLKRPKLSFLISFFTGLLFFTFANGSLVPQAWAAACDDNPDLDCRSGCHYVGECVNTYLCVLVAQNTVAPSTTQRCGNSQGSVVIGKINAPAGVGLYNIQAGGGPTSIGIIVFASRLIRLFTIIAGLVVFFNFILAGATLITKAGESKAYAEIQEKLTYSMIGVVIIVAVYIGAALIGLIFGDAAFILKPNIEQYGALAP